MEDNVRRGTGAPESVEPAAETRAEDVLSRITLALLEDYTAEHEKPGYDPYNTIAPSRAGQLWSSGHRQRR